MSTAVLASLVTGGVAPLAFGRALPLTIPSPSVVRSACAQVALHLRRADARWRVVCPTRIPYGTDWSCTPFGDLSVRRYAAGYGIDCDGVSSAAPGTVHWVLASGSPRVLGKALLHPTDVLGRPETHVTELSWTELGRQRVDRYLVAPSGMAEYTDHVVLVWTDDGEMFQVSVHRWPDTRIATEEATAVAKNLIARGA